MRHDYDPFCCCNDCRDESQAELERCEREERRVRDDRMREQAHRYETALQIVEVER